MAEQDHKEAPSESHSFMDEKKDIVKSSDDIAAQEKEKPIEQGAAVHAQDGLENNVGDGGPAMQWTYTEDLAADYFNKVILTTLTYLALILEFLKDPPSIPQLYWSWYLLHTIFTAEIKRRDKGFRKKVKLWKESGETTELNVSMPPGFIFLYNASQYCKDVPFDPPPVSLWVGICVVFEMLVWVCFISCRIRGRGYPKPLSSIARLFFMHRSTLVPLLIGFTWKIGVYLVCWRYLEMVTIPNQVVLFILDCYTLTDGLRTVLNNFIDDEQSRLRTFADGFRKKIWWFGFALAAAFAVQETLMILAGWSPMFNEYVFSPARACFAHVWEYASHSIRRLISI